MSDVKRMMYQDDRLFPTADDIKETGNLSEGSNIFLPCLIQMMISTILKKHF
jgi:hypothetical protein